MLDPDGGSLLLIFPEKFRRWLQPGGHVEPDDVDLVAADGGGWHRCCFLSLRRVGDRCQASAGCLPAMDIAEPRGIGRPGSSTFQYIQRNIILPQ